MKKDVKRTIIVILIFAVVTVLLTFLINKAFFEKKEGVVYKTKTGECYHSAECTSLKTKIPVKYETAKKSVLRPCSVCGGEPEWVTIGTNYPTSVLIALFIDVIVYFLYCIAKKPSARK